MNVTLEDRLFLSLQAAARGAGSSQVFEKCLKELVRKEDVFESERDFILAEIDSWFEVEKMVSAPDYWPELNVMRSFLHAHLTESVDVLTRYLPSSLDSSSSLCVLPIPGFAQCYGAAEGLQLFGLRVGADPEEALLFLTHVYYHEISSLFYTQTSRRAAAGPRNAELLKHWILLLIQNEGLANLIVLDPLMALRTRCPRLLYFTYAPFVRDQDETIRAMQFCREFLSRLDQNNFHYLDGQISRILKDPRLPIINLVGIHIAEVIAATFGERALFATANREPQEFFRMYSQSSDELRQYLFGVKGEGIPLFCNHLNGRGVDL